MNTPNFDYIIAGAGLAGLSLAYRMVHSELADKKILVVDQTLTPSNNRTWSFWNRGDHLFGDLTYKTWKQVKVAFDNELILQQLDQYAYHSIKSGDFREVILNKLRDQPGIELLEDPILSISGNESQAQLQTSNGSYTASYIFQSCFTPPKIEQDTPHYPLIQHFLGWEIETTEHVFDPSTVTLMDFDSGFKGGIAFVYILPQSPQKALLEYTIFSTELKPKEFYEEKLRIYIHNKFNLRPLGYETQRVEYGEIPMQDHPYAPWYAPRVLNMGTVGGLTKPSTGYTFSRIQRHAQAIVDRLIRGEGPALPYRSSFRYRAYDLWLLQIIHDEPETAQHIFRQLFRNNTMDEVFCFLSEENSLLQDFKTMSRVSYSPFFHAMWETRKRLFEI